MKIQDEAGRFFERYALQFDSLYDTQHRSGLGRWLNRRLRASMTIRFERTFAALRPMGGRSVLDIGCGSGRYLAPCLKFGASRIVGIDLSPAMLSLARADVDKLGDRGVRTELVHGDFLCYSFAERFDYAIVMGVMDYIADASQFLRKLRTTIRDKAVLTFPVAESLLRWQRALRYKIRRCPLYFYRYQQLDELVAAAGFGVRSIERIRRDYFVAVAP